MFAHSVSTPAIIAYSYTRCSTPEQEKGDTFRRQDEMAREFATRHGLQLDDKLKLRDKLSSFYGTNRKRGALGKFLELVRIGHVAPGSWLLIENIDRLSREPVLTAWDTFRGLLRSNIIIAILDMNWVLTEETLNDPYDYKLNAIIEMMKRANAESVRKSDLIRKSKEAKRRGIVEQGAVESHSCPAWLTYDNVTKQYLLNDLAPAIRRIFELAARHVSIYRICRQLKAEGFKPPISDVWQTSYISKTLRNEASIGIFRPMKSVGGKDHVYTGDVVLNHYPPVVSADLFKRANEAKRSRHSSSGAKGKYYANLFTRMGHCADCGSTMKLGSVTKRNKTTQYLICSGKDLESCSAPRNFRYDKVQDAVLRNVRELDVSKLLRDDVAGAKVSRMDAELAEAERRIGDLSEIIENLLDKIERTKGDASDLEERREKRKAERDALKAEATRLRNDREKSLRDFKNRSGGLEQVAAFMASLDKAPEAERYHLRETLSGVLRTFITGLTFHSVSREVHVRLWGGRRVYALDADNADCIWTEINVTLPGQSRKTVRAYLTEIDGKAKRIEQQGQGVTVAFHDIDEEQAVMVKLALG